MKTRPLILCALMAALSAAGALLRIPLPPAAITLQFFFALLSGVLLGAKYGALSQAIYVALGLFGLPVFAAGGGFTAVAQPSFGFVLGLVGAAWIAGRMTRTVCTARRIALTGGAALAVVYAVGLPYMALFLPELNAGELLLAGMLPFLPGDAVKIALCCLIAPRLRQRLPR